MFRFGEPFREEGSSPQMGNEHPGLESGWPTQNRIGKQDCSVNQNTIPVTTVGGYLGAGKTTLINHLLRNADGMRLAVLVNEFGALPIDADLVEASGDEVISITGGCICCAFGDSLSAALSDLVRLPSPPDHFLIEASGVAIPGSIAATVTLIPGLRREAVVVLADSETIRSKAMDTYVGDTIVRQLEDADLVLLNKTDLVTHDFLSEQIGWLATVAPSAPAIPITRGHIPPAVVLGTTGKPNELTRSSHSDRLFESIVLKPEAVRNPSALAHLVATGHFGVIRAKGHVIDGIGDRYLIQTVGLRSETTRATAHGIEGLVCIGLKGNWSPEKLLAAVADLSLS